MNELTRTTNQHWHEVILAHLVQAGDWSRPQKLKGVKFDRLNELEEHGIVEKGIDTNTGAAPASIYRITDDGRAYHSWLSSGDLFIPEIDTFSFEQIRFYLISGDVRDIYPSVIEYLYSGVSHQEKLNLCELLFRSQNGFLTAVANMYVSGGVAGLGFIDPNLSINYEWTERGIEIPYKAVNLRLSETGNEALKRVKSRVEALGLRPSIGGHTASDGFVLELALILMASNLDELLPYRRQVELA